MKKDDLPFEFECPNLLEGESGDRHCDDCNQTVYDLSALTRFAARKLLDTNPNVCVRFDYDERNSILFESRFSAQIKGAQKLVAAAAILPLLAVGCDGSEIRSAAVSPIPIVLNESGSARLRDPYIPPEKTRPTSSYDGNVAMPAIGVTFWADEIKTDASHDSVIDDIAIYQRARVKRNRKARRRNQYANSIGGIFRSE